MTFELSPRGREVQLILTHRRLGADELIDVASCWHTHLDILVEVENGRPPAARLLVALGGI